MEGIDEVELGSWAANMTVEGRAAGGRLRLSNLFLWFEMHGAERMLAGRFGLDTSPWGTDLGAIQSVDIAPRGKNPFDGSLRKRLRVTTTAGEERLFVVNRATTIAADINAALGR